MTTKISSANKASGETHAQFSNTLYQALEPGKYEIDSVCLPITWYNVTTSNNTITFYDYLTGKTATIPPGIYNTSTLAAAVKTAMDAVAGGVTYTVTYSTVTMGYTFTVSSGTFNFTWASGNGTAYKLLGFSPVDTANQSSVSSDQIVDLAYPRSVHLSIDPFSTGTYDSKGHIGYVIPVTENHGNIMYLSRRDLPNEVLRLDSASRSVRVTLRSDTGELLQMKAEWYFIIKRIS